MRIIRYRYRFQHPEIKELMIVAILSLNAIEEKLVQGIEPNPFHTNWDIISRSICIGLRDRHNQDICEGDTIRFTNKEANHEPTTVIWNPEDLQFQTQDHGSLTDSEFTFQGVAENIEIVAMAGGPHK